MLDLGTAFTVLLGAFGGAAATGVGQYYRNRRSASTAALLVYAELAENTAAVRYYRISGAWPEAGLRQVAWEQNSTTLAQLAGVSAFMAIRKGYAALEGIAFVAKSPPEVVSVMSRADIEQLLEVAIKDVSEGLRRAGDLAGMDRAVLLAEIEALQRANEPNPVGSSTGRRRSRAAKPR